MTNFDGIESTVAQQVERAELYVQTQGDKFHPLSDTLREIFEGSAESKTTKSAVLEELTRYEGSIALKLLQYHSYHTGRIREMLSEELDD